MCEDCFALYRDTDVYSACRWSKNSWEQFRTRNIEFFEHPNLLCIVLRAVSGPLHSSQTKILCKYFLLGQVLIFRPQERLLQLYLLQRVHGHLDGGQGDPAEGCPVHKVKQDFQTCLLKISNIIVERSNPHNFTFDYFSLYHYFIVDKLWFLFLVISLCSSHSKTIPLYRTVPTFIT